MSHCFIKEPATFFAEVRQVPSRALRAHEHEAGDQDRNDAEASSNHHD